MPTVLTNPLVERVLKVYQQIRALNACHRRVDCLVPGNRWRAEHRRGDAPADRFVVFGHQPPGAGRTLFLFGIAVGAVTSLRLRLLVADPWPAASRSADTRWAVARLRRKVAFTDRDRDTRLEHQKRTDDATRRLRRATGHDSASG